MPSVDRGAARVALDGVGREPVWPGGAWTMPVLAQSECGPVGWTSCPPGFRAEAFGCAASEPNAACSGARRVVPTPKATSAFGP